MWCHFEIIRLVLNTNALVYLFFLSRPPISHRSLLPFLFSFFILSSSSPSSSSPSSFSPLLPLLLLILRLLPLLFGGDHQSLSRRLIPRIRLYFEFGRGIDVIEDQESISLSPSMTCCFLISAKDLGLMHLGYQQDRELHFDSLVYRQAYDGERDC